MENLMEKLKTVDKKVWIGVGIGAAALIILVIALVVGGNKPAGGDTQGTEIGTEAEVSTEVFGTEDLTEVLGTEETTETEMATEVETEATEVEGQGNATGEVTVTQNEAVNGVDQLDVMTKEDGEAVFVNNDGVILEWPASDMTLTTVKIGAGNTQDYDIYNVGNMWFEITDPDMYVIDSKGTRHDSSFKVENKMPGEIVSFKIGNKGSEAKSFVLKFANLKGSWENPEGLSGNGPFSKHLNAGDDVGYWFSVITAQEGTLRIYMSATANTEMSVQNTDPNVTIARKLSEDVQSDEKGNYVEIPVKAGEEIRIHLQAVKPTRGSIPATDITFELMYY